MGLIRKSQAVGTLGVVNGSSRRQPIAKATMTNTTQSVNVQRQQLELDRRRRSMINLRRPGAECSADHARCHPDW